MSKLISNDISDYLHEYEDQDIRTVTLSNVTEIGFNSDDDIDDDPHYNNATEI